MYTQKLLVQVAEAVDNIEISAFCNKCQSGEAPLDVGAYKHDLKSSLNHTVGQVCGSSVNPLAT